MRLDRPFIRLPWRFDAARLAAEVAAFAEADWRPHPQGHPGNWAIPLVAVGGDPASDGVVGAMAPTPQLLGSPYLRQVLAAFDAPLGRTRLMRLDARAEATRHVDTNYYWLRRMRVHVPVLTHPGVRFECGDAAVHMAAGECWIFDTWRPHNVINPADAVRVHLVADTVGSPAFAAAVAAAEGPTRALPWDPAVQPPLMYERENFPLVMTPDEALGWWDEWCAEARLAGADPATLDAVFRAWHSRWRAAWQTHGAAPTGFAVYRELAAELMQAARAHRGDERLPNGISLTQLLATTLAPALHHAQVADVRTGSAATDVPDLGQVVVANAPASASVARARARRHERPLIILAPPRSGSTLLFETLAWSPSLYSVGNESHRQFETIPTLSPLSNRHRSNRLDADDADPATVAALLANFDAALRDRDGRPPPAHGSVRLLEKTPKNALRLPFLARVFPDARWLVLTRAVAPNLGSLLDGWESGRFVTYPKLPDWPGPHWSFALPQGWQAWRGCDVAEIVCRQYAAIVGQLAHDLRAIDPAQVLAVGYEDFIADPARVVARIAGFADIAWDRPLAGALPLSRHTLTPPDPAKHLRHIPRLAPWLALAEAARNDLTAVLGAAGTVPAAAAGPLSVATKVEYMVGEPEERSAAPTPQVAGAETAPGPASTPPEPARDFSSEYTTPLADLFARLGVSLLVSTYQSGHLIVVRHDGRGLNTHFERHEKPMGMAADRQRLVIGTRRELREYYNVPALGARIAATPRRDAVYALRNVHVTGDIDVHEIAIGSAGVWYVNTLFSCLCLLEPNYSFNPVWRPPFVSGYAPEDRCHLNGLALVDGEPRWLTALGTADTPQGWRANKRDGGVLLHHPSGDIVAGGLSMPHSPRWHGGRLWLLESGKGALCTVDAERGEVTEVVRVPGFTRGLDFAGDYAFIGLSQLREANAFKDIPVTEAGGDRACGVWVVHLPSGRIAGWLRFRGRVQEIFAVQALPAIRFPDIVDADKALLDTTYAMPPAALAELKLTPRPSAGG